ncbi:unnamed protein product [Linum trigynum]|uniref:Uncharacterized protein n=1 Tax=Linum trigynum TaxID=586398 RepID=A0AAV2EZL2_9ROSI
MEVGAMLHMNGGVGETSYAMNSLFQHRVILMTLPVIEEAISELCSASFPGALLAMADLGCSSGTNALLVAPELLKAVSRMCGELGYHLPEFQIFLNDLSGNDFNTVFRFTERFQKEYLRRLNHEQQQIFSVFFNGVTGSFYDRLFPTNSLHLVHSSYSLHWLSQVPPGLEGENKGNIYMASSSPESVLEAYYEQFQRDFFSFLSCRSRELVVGGRMVLTFLGRRSEDRASRECCYLWELLSIVLNQMASSGTIDQEKLDSFNIPQYTPSPTEVEAQVVKQGSFAINRLEVSTVSWDQASCNSTTADELSHENVGRDMAKCMRAVAEPLLVSQFGSSGEEVIDEIFRRYAAVISERMAKEKPQVVNVIVSLTNCRF